MMQMSLGGRFTGDVIASQQLMLLLFAGWHVNGHLIACKCKWLGSLEEWKTHQFNKLAYYLRFNVMLLKSHAEKILNRCLDKSDF